MLFYGGNKAMVFIRTLSLDGPEPDVLRIAHVHAHELDGPLGGDPVDFVVAFTCKGT